MSALIGVADAIAFGEVLSLVQTIAMGFGSESVYSLATVLDWWHILAADGGGGLIIGLLIQFLIPKQRLHSTGLVSAVASAVSLGAGASPGREDTIVHFSATLSTVTADKLKLGRSLAHTLFGCGVLQRANLRGVFRVPGRH